MIARQRLRRFARNSQRNTNAAFTGWSLDIVVFSRYIIRMMTFRAVIFDLDGTLLDTLQDLAVCTNRALVKLGFSAHAISDYRYFVGAGRDVLASRALPEAHRDAATVKDLLTRIDADYRQHWADHTRPYPGILELLDALTERGVRLAVLSNKAQEFTDLNVSNLLSRWHFDAVVGASAATPRKPDPTLALQIARQLKAKPAEFIYLGDSDIDMKTAVAAGMFPVGAGWGFRTASELQENGARAVIERPLDLLKLL